MFSRILNLQNLIFFHELKCVVCFGLFKMDFHLRIKIDHKTNCYLYRNRGVNSFLKVGGQVVMWRAAAGRRRLLFCQNMGGNCPPPPLLTPLLRKLHFDRNSVYKNSRPCLQQTNLNIRKIWVGKIE